MSQVNMTIENIETKSLNANESYIENTFETLTFTERNETQAVQDFFKRIEECDTFEDKIKCAIAFMEAALSHNHMPRFRDFWEVRKKLISYFKDDKLAPDARLSLWNQTVELSKEAHRLKAVFNEQSAFTAEQIDLAIQALEKDVLSVDAQMNLSVQIEFPEIASSLAHKIDYYRSIQAELQLLNAYAARVHSLRKEIIKTDMRIRAKNQLFQKLSSTGENVFPRRKELIKQISHSFTEDIQKFISNHFKGNNFHRPLFFLRDEIKALQGLAKLLTLNTTAFTETRALLSECWDKIKNAEKEKKKAHVQQKVAWKLHAEQCNEKLEKFEENFEELPLAKGRENLNEIFSFIKSQTVSYDDMKHLRAKVESFRHKIQDKAKIEEKERQSKAELYEQQKLEKFINFKNQITSLIEQVNQLDTDHLCTQREILISQMPSLSFSKQHRQELELILKTLRDVIDDKKERALLALPANERESIERIHLVLREKKAKRQEIEEQLKAYKKASVASGLNFEQAMKYDELIRSEKEILQRMNEGIQDLEDKLR